MIAFWAVVIYGIVLLRGPWRTGTEQSGDSPEPTLKRRLARGEISIDAYRRLLATTIRARMQQPEPPQAKAGRSRGQKCQSWRNLSSGWIVRGADAKHRKLVSDLLELRQWGVAIDGKMSPRSGRRLQVALQDRGAHRGINLLEPDALGTTVTQECFAACGTNVAHPVRLVAKHRHEIPDALVLGHHHRK